MTSDRGTIRTRLGWPADPATHRRIRRLWQRHSIAEDRRDIDGLIATELQLGSRFQIGGGILGPLEATVRQCPEVVHPRILGAAGDRIRQEPVGILIISRKVGVDATAIQIVEQMILRVQSRDANP